MRRIAFAVLTSVLLFACVCSARAEYCHFSWEKVASFDGYRYRHGAGVHEGRLFLWGGTSSSYKHRDLQVYDPEADTWSALPDLPGVKANFGFAIADGSLYAISGEGPLARETTSYRFDLLYEAWHEIADYPESDPKLIGLMCADGGNGRLYCFGGMEPSAITPQASARGHAYDPETDAWSPIADMPVAKGFGYAAFYEGKIYVTGGFPMEADALAYDVSSDGWAKFPDPDPRHGPVLAAAGDLLWLTAGGDVWDELVVPDRFFNLSLFDVTTWGEAGTAFSPGRVAAAGGYVEGFGLFLTGGEWTGGGGGTSDTYRWRLCVPQILAVTPDEGAAGATIAISAREFEASVGAFLFDDAKGFYPLDDVEVSDESSLAGVVPDDLPPGIYGLGLVGSLGQTGRLAEAFTIPTVDADDDTADDDAGDDDADGEPPTADDGDSDDGCGC